MRFAFAGLRLKGVLDPARTEFRSRRQHPYLELDWIVRTHRWRVTVYGGQVMGTSLYLREHHFPNASAKIAA